MTEIQQNIIGMLFIWLLFSFINLGVFRTLDKMYKHKYFLTCTYKLNKSKYLFSFYNRKTDEIAKYVFWLNIIYHMMNIAFLSSWIYYIIVQTQFFQILCASFAVSQIALMIVSGIFNIHYDIKSDKKSK